MKWSRRLRKRLTVGILEFGQRCAERGNEKSVERLRGILRGFTKTAYPLRRQLKKNLVEAGVYREGLMDEYFELGIDQMMMLAHILRAGLEDSGCLEKFVFDDSFSILERAYAKGKGVISIAPHISGYPIYGGIVSQRIPCVIYLRNNKDPKKMRITETIARAGGGELVYAPHNKSKAERLRVAINVLRQGRMLFLTPDTPKRSDSGVPVEIFGKRAYFPRGVFVMSLRTGAPVVPVWWHWADGAYHITYSEPIEIKRGGRLAEKEAQAVQTWAGDVDAFLRKHPEIWWNWLDKRWTKILNNSNHIQQKLKQ